MATKPSSFSDSAASIDPDEIGYFENLAQDWWDEDGAFAALQAMTPARVRYIKRHARRLLDTDLNGLSVLDIGCGGGLLAEPLARLGASVTGLDASQGAIATARDHADRAGLKINYIHDTAENLAETGITFDIVIASEVIEHVNDRLGFLKTMARFGHNASSSPNQQTQHQQPRHQNTMLVLTTINRSVAGVVLAKYAAEYVLGLAPKGTHDPKKFVKPSELQKEAQQAGIDLDDITGIQPGLNGFKLGGMPLMNYAASGLVR